MQHSLYNISLKLLLKLIYRRIEVAPLVVMVAGIVLISRFHGVVNYVRDFGDDISLISQAQAQPDHQELEKNKEVAKSESTSQSPLSNHDQHNAQSQSQKHPILHAKGSSHQETQEFDPLALDENQIKVLYALSGKEKNTNHTEEMTELAKQRKLLELAHEQINKRLEDIEAAKKDLQGKKEELTKDEKQNVEQMVKMYEAMKPQQAADIFNKLELTSLVQIIKHMNQKKASLIVASMESNRARQLTIELLRSKTQLN